MTDSIRQNALHHADQIMVQLNERQDFVDDAHVQAKATQALALAALSIASSLESLAIQGAYRS